MSSIGPVSSRDTKSSSGRMAQGKCICGSCHRFPRTICSNCTAIPTSPRLTGRRYGKRPKPPPPPSSWPQCNAVSEGLLDTNVFIHALSRDALSAECRTFLDRLKQGLERANLDPLVVHELTYALPRVHQHMSRSDVATHILGVLAWPGIVGEKQLLREAIDRWDQTPSLGFVDAYRAARASQEGVSIYTKNVRELVRQ